MGLDGGGAGGGGILGVTGSFTGPSEALEIAGDFAYAYSGLLDIGSAGIGVESSLVEFTTGNFIFLANFQFSYSEVSTDDFQYKIYMNESVVQQYVVGDRVGEVPDNVMPIVIPAYTKLKATAANVSANNDRLQCLSITGRIYR